MGGVSNPNVPSGAIMSVIADTTGNYAGGSNFLAPGGFTVMRANANVNTGANGSITLKSGFWLCTVYAQVADTIAGGFAAIVVVAGAGLTWINDLQGQPICTVPAVNQAVPIIGVFQLEVIGPSGIITFFQGEGAATLTYTNILYTFQLN
jgi:hypothetical protein